MYIEQKEFTVRLEQNIIAIQGRISQFVLITYNTEYHHVAKSDLANFIYTLQSTEA